MEKNQMRCFQIVAKTQNISEASRQLFISQPAVSQTISRMEDELGYLLFDRAGKRIILNENGKIMQKAIDAMNDIYADACRQIEEYNGQKSKEVSLDIGCASMHLPDLLERLQKKNPHIRYNIYQGREKNVTTDQSIHLTAMNTSQCGNEKEIFSITGSEQMTCEVLLNEKIILALPKKHVLTRKPRIYMDDLKEESWIALNENWSLGRLIKDAVKQFLPEISINILLDNPSLMRELLRKGMGIGFVPEISWKNFGKDTLVLRNVEGFDVRRCICICYRKDKYLTEAEKDCLDMIRQYFKCM